MNFHGAFFRFIAKSLSGEAALYKKLHCDFLFGYRLAQIRYGFRFIAFHKTALSLAAGDVFVNAVISLDQFGKSEITQFAVGFRCADERCRQDTSHRLFALRATGQRRIGQRLFYFDDLAFLTGPFDMFVLVNRHDYKWVIK